jgi:hypothetical protein
MQKLLLIVNIALSLVVLSKLGALSKKESRVMGNVDDLRKAVQDVKDAETAEGQRVEAIITLLKSNPSAEEVQAIISDLEGVATDLNQREAGDTSTPPTV